MTLLRNSVLVALVLSTSNVHGFQVKAPQQPATMPRREILANALIFATALTANQQEAQASARGYHLSRKLKAKETKLRETAPHESLPSGVAIQQFKTGRSGFGMFNCE